jgi:hypothetical protein
MRDVKLKDGHVRTDWEHLVYYASFSNPIAQGVEALRQLFVGRDWKMVTGKGVNDDGRGTLPEIGNVETVKTRSRSNRGEFNVYVSAFGALQRVGTFVCRLSSNLCGIRASAKQDALPEKQADSD